MQLNHFNFSSQIKTKTEMKKKSKSTTASKINLVAQVPEFLNQLSKPKLILRREDFQKNLQPSNCWL